MTTNQPSIETFDQWYFYDGYLCSPQGDRFSPECIRACFFYRQMKEVSHLLHWQPGEVHQDVVMEDLSEGVRRHELIALVPVSSVGQARASEPRARAPLGDGELLALLSERLSGDRPLFSSSVFFHD